MYSEPMRMRGRRRPTYKYGQTAALRSSTYRRKTTPSDIARDGWLPFLFLAASRSSPLHAPVVVSLRPRDK